MLRLMMIFATIGVLSLFAVGVKSQSSEVAAVRSGAIYAPPLRFAATPTTPRDMSDPAEVELYLDGIMAGQFASHDLVGATVAIVKDGKPFLLKGYGYADLNDRRPVDPDKTLFRPGSVSKLFTWTAVMQLVEQGKLDLDADVNIYLARFQIPDAYGRPVTLRNLMTHSAGFEDGALGYLFRSDPQRLEPIEVALSKHMPTRVRAPARDFSRGTQVAYSNWGTALAGYIVATRSGTSFEDYVDRNIFAVLNMSRSTFREPLPSALAPDLAKGYVRESGRFTPYPFEYIKGFSPAGSASLTASDMAQFMIAHLNRGAVGNKRILRPETIAQMHRRLLGPHSGANGAGLGFYETYVNGRRTIGHGGATAVYKSDLMLIPDLNIGLFVSYNTPDGTVAAGELKKAFLDRYFPATLPPVAPQKDFAKRASDYAGTYRTLRRSYTKFDAVLSAAGDVKVEPTKSGTLSIPDLRGKPTQWVEVDRDLFRQIDGEDMIAFTRDREGRVTHFNYPFAFMPFERLGFTQTTAFHALIIGSAALLFLSMFPSILYRWRRDREGPVMPRFGRYLLAATGAYNLATVGLLAAIMSAGYAKILMDIPASLKIAVSMPLLAIPMTIGCVMMAVYGWRKGYWTRAGRVHFTIVTLGAVAFLWSLAQWNLIGPRFG